MGQGEPIDEETELFLKAVSPFTDGSILRILHDIIITSKAVDGILSCMQSPSTFLTLSIALSRLDRQRGTALLKCLNRDA